MVFWFTYQPENYHIPIPSVEEFLQNNVCKLKYEMKYFFSTSSCLIVHVPKKYHSASKVFTCNPRLEC